MCCVFKMVPTTETGRIAAWVGSELGLLKSVEFVKNTFQNYGSTVAATSKEEDICCLTYDADNWIKAGCRNGTVKTFNTTSQCYEEDMKIECGESAIRGLCIAYNNLITCSEIGNLKVWCDQELKHEKSVGDSTLVMQQNPWNRIQVAIGGKENNLKIWDTQELKNPIYTAKNVRNDELELRVPVCVTTIGFMSDSVVVTATGYHQIRKYDVRAQRRPISDWKWEEYPITALSLSSDSNYAVVGNSVGSMASFDLRTGKPLGSFKGNAGAIRNIQCHQSQNYVASVGLDRFIRIYDLKSRSIQRKIYLKSRLSSLLLSQDPLQFDEEVLDIKPVLIESKASNETDGDNIDAIWDSMATVEEKLTKKSKGIKKKRKRNHDEITKD